MPRRSADDLFAGGSSAARLLSALVMLTSTGCAFTTISPAHRVDSGEVVLQGAIDEPGTLIIPRLSGAITYGFGNGDVGLHVGTSGVNVNAGFTSRLYTSQSTVLSLQADAFITPLEVNLFGSGQRYGALSVTPRFGKLLTEGERFYYGFELMGILPFNVAASWDLPSQPGIAAGGYVGLAFDLEGPVDLQVELSGAPVGLFNLDGTYEVTPTPIAQVGLAVQYRGRDREPPEPTRPPEDRPPAPPHDGRIY